MAGKRVDKAPHTRSCFSFSFKTLETGHENFLVFTLPLTFSTTKPPLAPKFNEIARKNMQKISILFIVKARHLDKFGKAIQNRKNIQHFAEISDCKRNKNNLYYEWKSRILVQFQGI